MIEHITSEKFLCFVKNKEVYHNDINGMITVSNNKGKKNKNTFFDFSILKLRNNF